MQRQEYKLRTVGCSQKKTKNTNKCQKKGRGSYTSIRKKSSNFEDNESCQSKKNLNNNNNIELLRAPTCVCIYIDIDLDLYVVLISKLSIAKF